MTPLPKVACFHGGGSNGAIFEVQCARLQDLLRTELEFVFFDAPFIRGAGPGVLPAFESYAPFRTWFRTGSNDKLIGDGSGYDGVGTDGIERVRRLMSNQSGGGQWVGAMGFSQGTRVVGGLLLDQQRREATGLPNDLKLKFGVLCNGGGAPMESHVVKDIQSTELVSVPTLHLHGLNDGILNISREQLRLYYDQDSTTLLEINYHHAMPWTKDDLNTFLRYVKEIYARTN